MSEEAGSKPLESSGNVSEEIAELESVSSQAAYDSFLTAAKSLEPGAIEECCADIVLSYHNVSLGVENVLGSGAVVIGKLPNVNVVELSMLPRLAQGLAYAALQVHRELQTASFGTLFERAQYLRRMLRKSAEALAEASLLADADIDEVRLHGQQDVVDDCLGLAAVFRRNEAKIAGRSPVMAADINEAEQAAGKLRVLLGQQGDTGDEGPSLVKVIEMRDRFWTLLSQRHDVLWRCGAWLYGRGVDDRVPPLPIRQAVVRSPRSAPAGREATRTVAQPRRSLSPPPLMTARPNPPSSMSVVRDPNRHLNDLQRDLERKTRFLVRIGAIPPPR